MEAGGHVIAKGFPVGDNHTHAWPPASFLATLTDEQRRDLLGRGSERRFERGATLMNQGETGDVVAVLLEGLVKVWALSPEGHESLLGLRGAGDLLGEMAFTTRSPRSARVVASTPIRARVLADHEFAAFLDRSPGAAVKVAAAVVHKLRAANQRRAEFQACSPRQRIAIILSEIAEHIGRRESRGRSIGPEVTQADVASLAAVSISTVEKELLALEREGLVQRNRRVLFVADPSALRIRAGISCRKPYGEGLTS